MGQRAQQTQLEVGSQPRNPRARVAVTDQAMGWEQREGPRGQREGPRGSKKGPEFSRFVSCGLDSPALVTQPRVPAVFLRGLQRPLGNPGADTCGPPGAASLLPALAESRQAREATDGRAARPPGWRTEPGSISRGRRGLPSRAGRAGGQPCGVRERPDSAFTRH